MKSALILFGIIIIVASVIGMFGMFNIADELDYPFDDMSMAIRIAGIIEAIFGITFGLISIAVSSIMNRQEEIERKIDVLRQIYH